MLNTKLHTSPLLFQAWVKNVYSLWVLPRVTGGYIYTGSTTPFQTTYSMWVKAHSFTHLFTVFTPHFFTVFLSHFNLLYTQLYTLSTPPIIKKNKKK